MKDKARSLLTTILAIFVTQPVAEHMMLQLWRRAKNISSLYPEAYYVNYDRKAEKKYIVLRYSDHGLFGDGVQYLQRYYALVRKGYTPLIDMELVESFKQNRIGENNQWDAFFEQSIEVKDVSKESFVLVNGAGLPDHLDKKFFLEINGDRNDCKIHIKKDNYQEYYASLKRYSEPVWRLKKEFLDEFHKEIGDLVENHRCLGVAFREEFSAEVKIENAEHQEILALHAKHPMVPQILDYVANELADWDYEYVFVSTIYRETISRVTEFFETRGKKVLYIDRERASLQEDIAEDMFALDDQEYYDRYMANIEKNRALDRAYLKEVLALSKCKYLAAAPSGGARGALIFNGGEYEDIYIFDNLNKAREY